MYAICLRFTHVLPSFDWPNQFVSSRAYSVEKEGAKRNMHDITIENAFNWKLPWAIILIKKIRDLRHGARFNWANIYITFHMTDYNNNNDK